MTLLAGGREVVEVVRDEPMERDRKSERERERERERW
jgi:hypothetical protein